jgi:hypothetical protein
VSAPAKTSAQPTSMPFSVYRGLWRAPRPLHLAHPGQGGPTSALRGAWGYALRRKVCPDLSWACAACPQRSECAYPAFFEPGVLGIEVPKRFGNPPRPFTLLLTGTNAEGSVSAGGLITSEFVVWGPARTHTPHALRSLQTALGSIGPRQGEAVLLRLEDVTPGRPVRPVDSDGPEGANRNAWVPNLEVAGCALSFRTPVAIRSGGERVLTPTAEQLVARLLDRLSLLYALLGSEPPFDTRATKALGAALRCEAPEPFSRTRARRTSGHRGKPQDLGGSVGTLLLAGSELASLWPWLWAGQWLGVGKNTVFGFGRYELSVLDADRAARVGLRVERSD